MSGPADDATETDAFGPFVRVRQQVLRDLYAMPRPN